MPRIPLLVAVLTNSKILGSVTLNLGRFRPNAVETRLLRLAVGLGFVREDAQAIASRACGKRPLASRAARHRAWRERRNALEQVATRTGAYVDSIVFRFQLCGSGRKLECSTASVISGHAMATTPKSTATTPRKTIQAHCGQVLQHFAPHDDTGVHGVLLYVVISGYVEVPDAGMHSIVIASWHPGLADS